MVTVADTAVPARERDRLAMRAMLASHGQDRCLQEIAAAVAGDIAGAQPPERVARVLEAQVLDGLIYVARALGWSAS